MRENHASSLCGGYTIDASIPHRGMLEDFMQTDKWLNMGVAFRIRRDAERSPSLVRYYCCWSRFARHTLEQSRVTSVQYATTFVLPSPQHRKAISMLLHRELVVSELPVRC
jgi:hypothetical protein